MSINGVTFTKGLGAHASSDVSYFLGGTCTRFKASIGIDDEVPASNGSVSFRVYADSTLVFQSASLNGSSPTVSVDVSVAGATTLQAQPRLGCDGGLGSRRLGARSRRLRLRLGHDAADGDRPVADLGRDGCRCRDERGGDVLRGDEPGDLDDLDLHPRQAGDDDPLAAAVAYASQVATLDPSADLAASTTYVATVKGGSSGAKDAAGNALPADVSWSFTTSATSGPPAGTNYLSDLTWTAMTNQCGRSRRTGARRMRGG